MGSSSLSLGTGSNAADSMEGSSKYPYHPHPQPQHHPQHPYGIHSRSYPYAYTGPDRYVKTVLTYASHPGTSNRRGNRGGANGNGSGSGGGASGGSVGQAGDRPLSFKSMARGPEGSNRVVVAANDGTFSLSLNKSSAECVV